MTTKENLPGEGESPASRRALGLVLAQRDAIDRYAFDFSVPLFQKLHNDGAPTLLATGWFFRCGTKWFLVSARHVFVGLFDKPSRFREPGANDSDLLVPVVGGSIAVAGPIHHAEGDDDVAVMELPEPTIALVRERWTPVTMDMVDPPITRMLPGPHFVAGFPKATMALDVPDADGRRRLHGDPFIGASLWDDEAAQLARTASVDFTAAKHIIIRYGCSPTDPRSELRGISGAPVWRLDENGGQVRLKLAGVETSVFGTGPNRHIRATRWWVVRELLSERDESLIQSSERLMRIA